MKISRRNFVQTLGAAAAITISGGGVKALAGTIGEKPDRRFLIPILCFR
jgi:hypothetical protein